MSFANIEARHRLIDRTIGESHAISPVPELLDLDHKPSRSV
jgi:hypothetical protein